MPGATIAKPPPMEVDPKAVRKLSKDEPGGTEDGSPNGNAKPDAPKPKGGVQGAGMPHAPEGKNKISAPARPSVKDHCKGPAELCRQDSAR